MEPWRHKRSAKRVGVALLVLSFLIGSPQLYWNVFVDEGDNLAVGVWLAHGRYLYRDLFSHHFPFPYYWAAAVTRCCGPSMLGFRLSILVFQTVAFAAAAGLTPFPLAVGITALVWRTIGYPYYGNLLIYSNFTGASLFVVYCITLATAGAALRLQQRHLIALGLFSSVAILSDPMALYPVCLSFLVLALGGSSPREACAGVAIIAVCLSGFLGYLMVTGTWSAFVADAIRFNAGVYRKYRGVGPVPLAQTLRVTFRLLDLFDSRWLQPSLIMLDYRRPDHWLATGFGYRLATILCALMLITQRRIAAGISLYAVAALMLGTMGDERFRANPFILIALFAASLCVTAEWRRAAPSNEAAALPVDVSRGHRWAQNLASMLRAPLALALLWLFAWGIGSIVAHRRNLSYTANFAGYEQRARLLRRLACNRDDVSLAYYPYDPLNHLFTGMPPASRYVFMLPWVAEIGLQDAIHDLDHQTAVVSIDLEGQVWGRKNREYLAPLITFLDARYVEELPGTYVSPVLAAECPVGVRRDTR